MKEKNLQIIQGDSFYLTVTKSDSANGQVEFNNTDKIVFSAKKNLKQLDYDIHSDKIYVVDGKIILYLSPNDTNIKLGTYYYDIQYTTDNNDVYTLLKGELEITWGVTN